MSDRDSWKSAESLAINVIGAIAGHLANWEEKVYSRGYTEGMSEGQRQGLNYKRVDSIGGRGEGSTARLIDCGLSIVKKKKKKKLT